MWTKFMDTHSGGDKKENWENIYIEAPKEEAKVIFYNRFGHNPDRVTCTCCGPDYSIYEEETLAEVTAFERGCDEKEGKYVEEKSKWSKKLLTLAEYKEKEDVLFINEEDIKPEERTGSVPIQGYVWID